MTFKEKAEAIGKKPKCLRSTREDFFYQFYYGDPATRMLVFMIAAVLVELVVVIFFMV